MRSVLLRDLQVRWLDFLLGSLLIAVVCTALFLQRSLSSSAEAKIHELAHHLGKNMLVLPAAMDVTDFYEGRYGSATMPAEYLSQLRSSHLNSHIRDSTALLYGSLEQDTSSLVMVGMDPWYGNEQSSALGLVASKTLQASAQGSFTTGGVTLTVSEIVDSPPDGLDRGIFTSLATAQKILDKPAGINALRLGGCWCRMDVATLATEVEKVLPGTQAITVAGMVKAQKGTIKVMEEYSMALYAAGIAIIVGTIIVLISAQVRRSLPELGLLLAMGASPLAVSGLFMLKAGLMGGFGAFFGFVFAKATAGPIGSALLETPLQISFESFWPILVFSSLLSLGAASIPAWRASQLDPTEVLRND